MGEDAYLVDNDYNSASIHFESDDVHMAHLISSNSKANKEYELIAINGKEDTPPGNIIQSESNVSLQKKASLPKKFYCANAYPPN